MDIRAISIKYQMEVKPGHILTDKLRSRIQGFEKEYSVSSGEMWAVIQQDPTCETEEISQWMQAYTVLGRIENGIGTTGTH